MPMPHGSHDIGIPIESIVKPQTSTTIRSLPAASGLPSDRGRIFTSEIATKRLWTTSHFVSHSFHLAAQAVRAKSVLPCRMQKTNKPSRLPHLTLAVLTRQLAETANMQPQRRVQPPERLTPTNLSRFFFDVVSIGKEFERVPRSQLSSTRKEFSPNASANSKIAGWAFAGHDWEE
jgi:hypothetical protein